MKKAARSGDSWNLAYDGNGIVPCQAIAGYDFPKDLVPQCLDTKNNNLVTR